MSDEEQPEQPEQPDPPEPPEPEQTSPGGVKAKPVTRKMLQAAARAPTDVVDILKAEANALKKRAERGQPPPKRERKHTSSSVIAAARALQAKHESEDDLTPIQGDDAESASAPAADGEDASRAAAKPTAPAKVSPPPGHSAPARSRPVTPAPLPTLAPAPSAPPPSQAPLAAAVVVAGLLVAAATLWRTPAPTPPATTPAPASTAPAQPAAAPVAQPPAAAAARRPGAVAELGDNRVLYTAGRGELVVLWRDPSSGELEVERVYQLSRDAGRDLGQAERRYHAWYLDDLHVTRRAALRKANNRYEAMVELARSEPTGLEQAEAAAAKLARLGGADRLVKHLAKTAGAIHHRSATIGLAEAGYLCAVPHLLDLLKQHGDSPAFARRAIGLLSALTGLKLSSETADVLKQVQAWQKANPLKNTYQRAD